MSEARSAASKGNQPLSIGQCATFACLIEATVPKPGNVHRGADFENMTFMDFVASAVAIGPCMQHATRQGVGPTVLDAIQATRRLVRVNTNLGTVLLVAPLATVPRDRPLASGVRDVLAALTPEDARCVYEAIRLAEPGGLGATASMDVAAPAPANLIDAMQTAADRDLVARQYANGFEQVLDLAAPLICQGLQNGWSLTESVIHAHVTLLSRFPDSLIARKCGLSVAEQASRIARQVLDAGSPGDEDYLRAMDDLDFWLRSDGNRRNPGTTADLIAAGLFVALRDGTIEMPLH
jgi:triphosphoribosyl-dephospho-CoA synthase